jgi:RNA recognition motif-containing protein
VIDVRIVTDKNTGRAKGYAYIQYDNAVSMCSILASPAFVC